MSAIANVTIKLGQHDLSVPPLVAARIKQLEDLCEEAWNVLVTANLSPPDARAALSRLDRRLREAGLKRFPVAMGLPESSERQLEGASDVR